MKLAMLCLAAIVVALPIHAAFAHGGAYRGPSGEVPPGRRDPKDPQPPGGPPPLPPAPSDPPPPRDPQPPRPEETPPGTGLPSPRIRLEFMNFENWLFWWHHNKDAILLQRTGTTPRPLTDESRRKLVVALERMIANREIHPDIRAGAVIALARAEPTRRHLPKLLALAARESREEKIVRESAALSLGLLGFREPEVRACLLKIVRDREDAMRGRCFAMVALGLIEDAHDDVRKELEARVAADERHLDVPISALFALGLVGDERSVPTLVRWLESGRIGEKKLPDLHRSWIVAALGRIGGPASLEAIRKTLRAKSVLTKRSAAIAIGRIAPRAPGDIPLESAKELAVFCRREKNLTARNFAMMSLGRIAGDARVTAETRALVKAVLRQAFRYSNRVTERPFVALAMGLTGDAEWKKVIRTDLEAMKGDKVALGAQAIALGLLDDTDSVPTLTKILADRGAEKRLRGAAAVGLGLIGGPMAEEAILRSLRAREDRDLRIDTVLATGLTPPRHAVSDLLKVLDDKKASQFVLGSTTIALGRVGDDRAVDPLIAILEPGKADGTYPDLTRALAAVALGRLADRREHRVLHRLSEDLNYRAMVPALEEILSIL